MKRIRMIAVTVLTLALLVYANSRTPQADSQASPKAKQVKVNAQTIARLPAAKKYVVDLSRKGTIYEFDPDVDFNRVVVRTAAGEQAIGDWQEKTFSKKALTESFRIGATEDFRKLWGKEPPVQKISSGTSNFVCAGKYCDCTGALDCGNMILSGSCGTWIRCTSTQCICEAKL